MFQTIGCDFFENTVTVRGQRIQISVWDIGGQSVTSKNLPNYLSGASVVLMVYDLTNTDSFRNVVCASRSAHTHVAVAHKRVLLGGFVAVWELRRRIGIK